MEATRIGDDVQDLQRLVVGQKYPVSLPVSASGGARYSFDVVGQRLALFYPGATGEEVRNVRKGEARFALVYEEPAIFFMFSFGKLPWSDAPFSVHLVPEEWRRVRAVHPGDGGIPNALEVHMVDSRSGVIKALKMYGLPHEFMLVLEKAVECQLQAEWKGRGAYEAALDEIYRRYPTSEALLGRALCVAAFDGR